DSLKTYKLYDWVKRNIEYDSTLPTVRPVNSKDAFEQEVETSLKTLKLHKGICYDYAVLFKTLMHYAHVPCEIVYGIVKDPDNNDTVSHAWNIVIVNGTSRVVDCTW